MLCAIQLWKQRMQSCTSGENVPLKKNGEVKLSTSPCVMEFYLPLNNRQKVHMILMEVLNVKLSQTSQGRIDI